MRRKQQNRGTWRYPAPCPPFSNDGNSRAIRSGQPPDPAPDVAVEREGTGRAGRRPRCRSASTALAVDADRRADPRRAGVAVGSTVLEAETSATLTRVGPVVRHDEAAAAPPQGDRGVDLVGRGVLDVDLAADGARWALIRRALMSQSPTGRTSGRPPRRCRSCPSRCSAPAPVAAAGDRVRAEQAPLGPYRFSRTSSSEPLNWSW